MKWYEKQTVIQKTAPFLDCRRNTLRIGPLICQWKGKLQDFPNTQPSMEDGRHSPDTGIAAHRASGPWRCPILGESVEVTW